MNYTTSYYVPGKYFTCVECQVRNVPPQLTLSTTSVNTTATLRIAGEKWHDVSAYLVDGVNETLVATLTRQPGKPQETSFLITLDLSGARSLRITYTPDDDRVNGNRNGATPAWLTFRFDGGGEETYHHTFNVRHPETWNWTVGLSSMMAGSEITFIATATDPGMDDLTFEWDFGDGSPVVTSTYLNGGTFPFTVTDVQTHTYAMAGTYDVKVRVSDDDGGVSELSITVIIV